MPKRKPNKIDILIGQGLRKRRNEWNISAQSLGIAIGVSYQQIIKYEKAQNRIPASTLYQIAWELSVPLEYFIEDVKVNMANSIN